MTTEDRARLKRAELAIADLADRMEAAVFRHRPMPACDAIRSDLRSAVPLSDAEDTGEGEAGS